MRRNVPSSALHATLNNVYRIEDVFFIDAGRLCQDLRSDFACASQTAVTGKTGEITASKHFFARNGGSLLKFACFLRLKRARKAFSFNSPSAKLPVEEMGNLVF